MREFVSMLSVFCPVLDMGEHKVDNFGIFN